MPTNQQNFNTPQSEEKKKACICLCLCSLLCFFNNCLFAQEKPDSIPLPKVEYFTPKPKLFSISIKSVTDFKIDGESDNLGNDSGEVSSNLRRDVYLRAPIYMKHGTIVGLGLRYRHEKFKFENPNDIEYNLYRRLKDKGLRSAGVDILFQRKDDQKRVLQGNLGIRLNGDTYTESSFGNFLKLSLFMIYKKQKNERTEIGYGFAAGYDLGSPLIYPLFSYQHHFSKRFCIDLNLPKQANLVCSFSGKSFLTWTSEISGASYHIGEPLIDGFNRLEIRKSEFRSYFRFEREIHDWLWLGVEAGAMQYINFYVSEPRQLRNDALITLQTKPATFFKIGIFAVPPKKIYDIMK